MNFDVASALKKFQIAIVDNARVAPTHVSLYLAIVFFSSLQDFKEPTAIFRRDLMKHAKICGDATYIKCIQDLQEFGFIKYTPSYNPLFGSLFYLINIEN